MQVMIELHKPLPRHRRTICATNDAQTLEACISRTWHLDPSSHSRGHDPNSSYADPGDVPRLSGFQAIPVMAKNKTQDAGLDSRGRPSVASPAAVRKTEISALIARVDASLPCSWMQQS
jgi:hypothetical protein